jgi:glycosyltransferase involved in cell wall biosynthesis
MPTRNRAQWLRLSLASVLEQTYEDFAVIVSDNASEDETRDVVASFDDPRISYVRQSEDVGLVRNHNDVLGRVESEYSLILPDDDIAYPELLEATVEVLDRLPRAGMVHSNLDMIDPPGDVVAPSVNWTLGLTADTVESGSGFIRESMKYSCRVCASSALMRMAALPRGFFDQGDFPPVDLGLWLRMALDWDMAFVARTLCAYRIHESSHSSAFGETIASGYRLDTRLVRRLEDVKLKFVDAHADRLEDPQELRRLARGSVRRELLVAARQTTLPERRFRPTASALGSAALEDPRIILTTGAWKLLGGSMIGPRLTAKLRRRGARA